MSEKNCSACKVKRDISFFINDKKKECKTCEKCREKSKKSHSKHKEQRLEYNREWRKQNKERVKIYNKSYKEGTDWTDVKEKHDIKDSIPKISSKRKDHIIIDDVLGKNCSACKDWKPLEKYNKCSRHWDGLKVTCMDCFSQYRANTKDRMTEYNKRYWIETKEQQSEKHKQWARNNRDHINEYGRKYKKIWEAEQRATNPRFKLLKNLRSRLWHAVRDQNATKQNNTLELTGCTISFLKKYLESKFKDNMSWENYGEWHVDHIKPCSKYDLTKEKEQYKCFHYTNLQPLWGSENCSKGSKYTELEEESESDEETEKETESEIKPKSKTQIASKKKIQKQLC